MGESLVMRLRAADGFAGVAAAVIDDLGTQGGVVGVAVEAHVGGEPALWFGTTRLASIDAARYLDGAFGRDALLARVREVLAPVVEGLQYIAPIVGCGELVGAIRVVVDDPARELRAYLAQVSLLASVRIAQLGDVADDAYALTARQHEVAVLVSRGCTNQEIADMLAISANAVKKHVSRALDALGVSNRAELAALASRWSGTSQRLTPAIHVVRSEKRGSCARAA
jgi:DNA-binding NarL/FixJ family response regulator